ncbi:MAG: histidine kinase [Propioniciclava sp.]|uniref:sensor histidine kinase n=1 Tax=Propioniciclava sp. TaxID=2038686 RepID=UPI0039E43B93
MRHVLRPFPWWSLAHLALGIVLAPVLALAGVAVALVTPLAVFVTSPFLLLTRLFDALIGFDRARFAVLLDRQVGVPLTLPDAADAHARVRAVLADPAHQRAAGYAVVRVALAVLQGWVLTAVALVPALLLATLVASVVIGYQPHGRSYYIPDPQTMVVGVPVLIGLVTIATPLVIRGLAWLDAWASRALLGSVDAEELERRVGELVDARARTVNAADAERAKLERDLHDGAQQRLIALSVLLGQAEARLADAEADDGALALVRRARAETTGTIDELRTLTRGLRPPILEARGLDAALSAVAARLPMTVGLDIRLPERPDPALEAMLYFAVTEALTNVAKHGGGATASVTLERDGGLLRATVADDGPGGADVAGGTGLRGIADRLSGVDGRLFLSSPPGGGTVVTVEVPCA